MVDVIAESETIIYVLWPVVAAGMLVLVNLEFADSLAGGPCARSLVQTLSCTCQSQRHAAHVSLSTMVFAMTQWWRDR
eukprot:6157717-Amphidinium_carterae.1